MNRQQAHRAAHAIIDRLVDLEPGHDTARGPGWRKAVRNRIRHEHWPTLTAILSDDHDTAVTAITQLIAGPTSADHDPQALMSTARQAEIERNHRRIQGLPPLCPRCDDTGIWFDTSNLGHECSCKTGNRSLTA